MMQWNELTRKVLRLVVRSQIEQITGRHLPQTDPLPDHLIGAAEAKEISLETLRAWLNTLPNGAKKDQIRAADFLQWAQPEVRGRV